MQANEPTGKEYGDIFNEASDIVSYTVNSIQKSVTYARRMYSSYSEVDNGYLAGALDHLTRSLTTVGEDAEYVRLHALACQTEAKLREEKDQQNHPVKDDEAEDERRHGTQW